jgi:bifunctional non-homologous end joining protein LigD
MQASSVEDPFDSPDWIFETKLDGYRAIAAIEAGEVAGFKNGSIRSHGGT